MTNRRGAGGPGRWSAASGRCGASPTGVPAECARERCNQAGPRAVSAYRSGPGQTCPRVGRPACGRTANAWRMEPGAAGRSRRPATAREGGRYAPAGRRELPVTADDDLARVLAVEAGRRLLARRARGGDAGDLRAAGTGCRTSSSPPNWAASARGTPCCRRRPVTTPARLAADRVWIVDPLDGTRSTASPAAATGRARGAVGTRELTAGRWRSPPKSGSSAPPNARRRPARRTGQPGEARVRPAAADRGQRSRPRRSRRGSPRTIGATLMPLGSAGRRRPR